MIRGSGLLLLTLFMSSTGNAAPCCASNAAIPSLIVGDEAALLSATASYGRVIGDAPSEGLSVFRTADDNEITRTLRLDSTLLLADRWQAGVGVPLVQRTIDRPGRSSEYSGVGDISLGGGFEYLPELDYSEWKPQGVGFLQLTLPTGRSIYESQTRDAVDVTGRGMTTVTLGTFLIKRWARWDASVIPEAHYSFERSLSDARGQSVLLEPTHGFSLSMGGGYSPRGSALRFGGRVAPVYNQGRSVTIDGRRMNTGFQYNWNTFLECSYLVSDDWSLNSVYMDQTIFGPAINTTLDRSVSINLSRRWSR